jgi:hypothetical protein
MTQMLTFILGVATGIYLAAQAKALHIPEIIIPSKLHIDPVAVVLTLIFYLALYNLYRKRTYQRRRK